MPTVSVIIPAYKAQDFIGKAVKSILQQTYKDLEIIIISDDQQDYFSILEAHNINDPRIQCVSSEGIATGAAAARNIGLKRTQGRIIIGLDADDRWAPDAFATVVPLALQYGAVYSASDFIDFKTGKHLFNCNQILPEGKVSLKQILNSNIHTFSGIVFDRQRLPDVRWLNGIPLWEDLLFGVTCYDRLGYIYYTPKSLHLYYHRQGSICNMPNTGEVAQYWAREILKMLLEDKLDFKDPKTKTVLKDYFTNRTEMERDFIQAMKNGECTNYQDFMRKNLDKFYNF